MRVRELDFRRLSLHEKNEEKRIPLNSTVVQFMPSIMRKLSISQVPVRVAHFYFSHLQGDLAFSSVKALTGGTMTGFPESLAESL